MLSTATHHLCLIHGTTCHEILLLQDDEGNPTDLTGYTASAHARSRPGSANLFPLPFVVTDEPAGEITIDMTPEDVSALPLGRHVWTLLLTHIETGRVYGPYIAGDCLVRNQ
jgi:hypothetical protein